MSITITQQCNSILIIMVCLDWFLKQGVVYKSTADVRVGAKGGGLMKRQQEGAL